MIEYLENIFGCVLIAAYLFRPAGGSYLSISSSDTMANAQVSYAASSDKRLCEGLAGAFALFLFFRTGWHLLPCSV